MDHPESNKNKAKNWLYRFLKIKNRLHDRPELDPEVYNRDVVLRAVESPEATNCTRTRSSFRRSLKKMHTRVKSCMFPQKPTMSTHYTTIGEIPCSSTILEPEPITPPPVPERPLSRPLSDLEQASPREDSVEIRTHRIPTDEILSLSMCYWYWGPMSTKEAEEKLELKPDGTFLVRDSSSTSYLFSISFRSVGKTMHARIEYNRGKYNLYGSFTEGFSTITELIHDAIKISENGIYCYSRRGEDECEFPVRLTKPISRYTEVRSLKYLCKFIIRQCTNINDIPKLPLPTVLHSYLQEKPYF
ncbi:SH2 and/or SOCS box domain containing protein [Asbolus verrucosus]|uniref:SH2 and/or SOCS box domain containing protein n=1 Tax=Asbolus verrucosus TaxID=1661398 RepID=A0A482W1Y1_ASBVE|nr:SH2 and/or SOCS box domain containing protein [Asbolus verrucosus]